MTVLFNAQTISKAFGDDTLFTDLSFDIKEGEKLGLIGMNGSGKSTLLRIIAGLTLPDEGEAALKPAMITAFLAQEDELDPDLTVEQILYQALESQGLDDKERHRRVNQGLGKGGFIDPSQKVCLLSGGWRKRLSIVRALSLEPDLLLLDEPTNHLDIAGILWLETILNASPFSFVLVSHDRIFLENVCSHTMEIARYFDRGYFKIQGQYRLFEKEREKYLEAQAKRQASLASKMRREEEWLRQGPKARTSKAKYRIEQAETLRQELAEVQTRNRQTAKVDIDFSATGRQTKKLIRAHNLTKAFDGQPLFAGLTFELGPGFCLGVVGDNGSGKSTFLSLVEQKSEPDLGNVKWAENLKVAVFDQNRTKLNPEHTLRQALNPEGGDAVMFKDRSLHVVSWAKRFLFMPDQLDMPVGRLSGGEKARIILAGLMRQPCDVLLLDEPTNDLDILSLEVLETSIREFPGAVIIVSHDRYLMDNVCHRILYLDKGHPPVFYKTFDQIMATRKDRGSAAKPKKTASPGKPAPKKKKKTGLTYKDKFELEHIEEKILEAEEAVAELTEAVQAKDVVSNPEKLTEICARLETAESLVQHLYDRWEELEAKKAEDS